MRGMRWILVAAMLVVAVSGYAQHTSGVTIEPPAGSPAIEPSGVGMSAESRTLGTAITDDPGAAIAASVGRSRKGGKRVLWDLTHGVYSGYDPYHQYTSLYAALSAEGFEVRATTSLANSGLSLQDILVLNVRSAWDSAYTAAEVDQIRDFVADGGALLIMADDAAAPNANLQPVAAEFGATLGGALLSDSIGNFLPHPVFAGVGSVSLDGGGQLGAAAPSVSAAWDSSDRGAVNAAGYGYGRVIVVADVHLWDNSHLAYAHNTQFAINVFNWLSFSQKRVLWDLTHGVYSTYEPSGMYSSLVTTLGAYGHCVTTTEAGLASEDLSQYDTLVLNVVDAHDSAYTTGEADIVKDFVAGGGGLLLVGDHSGLWPQNLNPVATEFGTTLGGETTDNTISSFLPHPLFDGVTSIQQNGGGALTAAAPSVKAAWDGSNRGVVNAAGYGNGRVVVIGDINAWSNDFLDDADNTRFAVNVFNWLSVSQRRVLWDLTHGAYLGYEPSDRYTSLVTALGAYGHFVATTVAGLLNVNLSQYDTLVLNVADTYDSAYTAAEAERVAGFVAAGGGLVIMGSHAEVYPSRLNPVATEFGTTLGGVDVGGTISNFIPHPVFDGVSSIWVVWGGQLTATAPSVTAAWDASDRGVVNIAEYYAGRMVAIGDISAWENIAIGEADNLRFATNVFDWVAHPSSENRLPVLYHGDCEPYADQPETYAPNTEFRFHAHYYDGDGNAPTVMKVVIDSVQHTMTLSTGRPSSGVYEYRTTLSTGAHAYHFYAADGDGGDDRLPTADEWPGPFICRARVNNNNAWTSLPDVSVEVWSRWASKVRLKNVYTATWQGPFDYTPSSGASVVLPWTLAAGSDGPRAVYVLSTLPSGRQSNVFCDTIVLDTIAAPVIKSFFINNRAATASTLNVTVKVFVDCATDLRFRNKYDDPWGAWQPLSQCNVGEFPWTLAAGADGQRAVYVQARDHHGNLSAVRCDTIEVNTGG